MNKPKKHFGTALIQLFMFILLFLLYYSGLLRIPSLHANTLILMPFLVSFCMFSQELPAALTGLLLGIFTDAFSSDSSYFHTLFFFLIGVAVSVMVHYLLNVNFRSAIMLSILSTLLYYLLRWLFFYAFKQNVADSTGYLIQYALPSVIYTNLFIVPFFFLQKRLNKHKNA